MHTFSKIQNQNESSKHFKLIMNLAVKNEERILEQNIRFHKAMGIDGFIVTDHNSTDNTPKILEKLRKEGLVYEVILEKDPAHLHSVWFDKMIKLATNKYHADWVINADADEFYYSKSLDFKKSICAVPTANVLYVHSTFLFPDNRENFFSCPYFITKHFHVFEAEMRKIDSVDYVMPYIGPRKTLKVIHKTQGYLEIASGNHDVRMENKVKIQSADIVLYHYHMQNYEQYEAKARRWAEAEKYLPGQIGFHISDMMKRYKEGKLKEYYDAYYGETQRKYLMEQGILTVDKSMYDFLKYYRIL